MSDTEEVPEDDDPEEEEVDEPPPPTPPREHAWLDTWWGRLIALAVGAFNWWALIHYTM